MITAQKKQRISALLPSDILVELRKMADATQVSLNALFQRAVEDWLQKKLQKDAEDLSKLTFDDLPTEDEWHSIQSSVS